MFDTFGSSFEDIAGELMVSLNNCSFTMFSIVSLFTPRYNIAKSIIFIVAICMWISRNCRVVAIQTWYVVHLPGIGSAILEP